MKIKISNLKAGVHEFVFAGNAAETGFGIPFIDDYRVTVSVEKSSHQVLLRTNGVFLATFECDRCGTEFVKTLDFSYKLVYIYSHEQSSESEDESVKYIGYDADSIDIFKDTYDFAHLSLPMKRLCKEDCLGLCLVCGQDFNAGTCDCNQENKKPEGGPFSILNTLKNNTN